MEAVYQLELALFLTLTENDRVFQAVFLNIRNQAAVILSGLVLDVGAGQRFDFGEGYEAKFRPLVGLFLIRPVFFRGPFLIFGLGRLLFWRLRRFRALLFLTGQLGGGVHGGLGVLRSLLLTGGLGEGVCGDLGGFRSLLLTEGLGRGVCGDL